MSTEVVTITMLLLLLAASTAALIGGVVLARSASGTLSTVGWWIAIVASLFVLAFGTVVVMGLVTSASLGQWPLG
ncbi:hypothetical protein [Agrococcus sp. Ld7]|uniref:hypothetical protein n=1 Tax=Agrococcus sp. Ld7 TaxID=649148 RepID=UPI003869F871